MAAVWMQMQRLRAEAWSSVGAQWTEDALAALFSALIVAGSCWLAEWSADEFIRDRLWRGGLLTAKEGLAKPVRFQNFVYEMSGSPSRLQACVSFVLLESRLVCRQEGPSLWTWLWNSDAYPAVPSKCQVEMCLLMTTTPLCYRMDWWRNTQRTVTCSPPDHLSLFILQRVPPGTLLHCPQTKVHNFVRLMDKNYNDFDKHHII